MIRKKVSHKGGRLRIVTRRRTILMNGTESVQQQLEESLTPHLATALNCMRPETTRAKSSNNFGTRLGLILRKRRETEQDSV